MEGWRKGKEGMGRRTGDEALVEGLLGQVLVVLLQVLLGWSDEFYGRELVAAFFEAGDDVPHQAALDAVGFDGYETVAWERRVGLC